MSDPIETGALRRVRNISRPRSQPIGKRGSAEAPKEVAASRRDADHADDGELVTRTAEKRPVDNRPAAERNEMELGRFSGRFGRDEPSPKTAKARPADGNNEVELGRFSGQYSPERRGSKTAKRRQSGGDEAEIGRFSGRYSEERAVEKAGERPAKKSEVVGPKRQKSDRKKASSKQKNTVRDLEIAATRDTSEDAAPSRKRAKRRSRRAASSSEGWGRLATLALLSVVLVALTAATFLLLPRYEILGDPLIADPAFEDGLNGWEQEGLITFDKADPARVSLQSVNADTPTFLTRDIELTAGDTLLVLRAEVQGDDVEAGPEIWDQARIYLVQLDAAGEPLWDEDHELFDLNGTTDVRNYSRAFAIPDETETVRIGIELKNATGQLTVSKLELIEAKRPLTFVILASGLILAWGALTLYSAFRTLKGIDSPRIRLWLGIACALSVAALMLPGDIHEVWIKAIAGPLGMEDPDVDVIGHGVVFTVLAFLVRLGRPLVPIWMHIGVWLLIAIASEVAQLFTFDREPSVEDLIVDGIGILLGLALAETARSVQRWRTA